MDTTTEAASTSHILAHRAIALDTPQSAVADRATSPPRSDVTDFDKFKERWELHGKLPLDLSASFPLQGITFSHLANLKPGMLLHSVWPAAEDVPLLNGEIFLANVSFEPVGSRLGVRLSSFAPRPISAGRVSLPASEAEESKLSPSAADILKDLWLSLSVCVGTAQVSLQEILQWAIGDTIPLDRPVNAPVNIVFKEKIVAGGNLVLVGGVYAVRLTDVAQRFKRLPPC